MNKLKTALDEFSYLDFDLIWRPFQLNPDMPKKGMDRQKYLEFKFGDKKNAKQTYQYIYDVGLNNNIHFQFEKIRKTPNSFASHKLIALAHQFNKQTAVVETLFYAYFIEGVDIGYFDKLQQIAKQHEINDKFALQYLKSDKDRENLLAEEMHARELGIKGVPCFIINKEFVLFGVQDKSIFLDVFNKIYK